jgi:hypothetical protein
METPAWNLRGTVLIACNCDYGCPCNFNALPTKGYCEGGWTWHVETGRYGETALDGLNFSVYVKWPGPIHEGNGHALILLDERADGEQRQAIETLIDGGVGGPWGVLGWTWPIIDGPHAARYELELDGVNTRLRAGEWLELAMEPIRNPVSGAEVRPGAVLPQGIILKRPDFGSSKQFQVRNGIELDYPDHYTAVGPFEYSGPA